MKKFIQRIAVLLAFAAAAAAHGQAPGVSGDEILIGQDVDLSGSIAVRMKTFTQAADAYLDAVNRSGGVNGRKIRVVRVDSNNKPDKTKENVKALVEGKGVFAMWA